MKPSLTYLGIPTLALAAALTGALPARAQYVWTKNSNGSYDWGTAANWKDSVLPPDTAAQQVRFDAYTSSSPTVNLDKDRQLNAGIFISGSTTNIGTLTLNLAGHRLTINGSDLLIDPNSTFASNRTTTTFTGGTLQLGGASSANFIVGAPSGEGYAGTATSTIGVAFAAGTTLDSANLGNLQVAASAATRLQNLELDLSAATLVSGAEAGALKVGQSLIVGHSSTTGPAATRHKYGSLKLGIVSNVEVGGDLLLGINARTNGSATNARGTLTFSNALEQGAATLSVGGAFRLGVGAGSEGTIAQAPATLHTAIGTELSRGGAFHVGYKATAAVGDATGSFVAQSGSFNAWITELRIGQNTGGTGEVSGVVDLRNTTLGTLDVAGAAIIGGGTNAQGELRLRGGAANSTSLTVGAAAGAELSRSLLSLNGTEWTLSESFTLGALGDLFLTVTEGGAGGLTLLSDQVGSFAIEAAGGNHGTLNIAFESTGSAWGLRLAGDRTDLLETYLEDQFIVAGGTYGNQAVIWQEGGFTYLGYTAVPEPSTFFLAGLLAAGWAARRMRKPVA